MLNQTILATAALAAFSTATPALATPEAVLPSRADVTGVAADDELNIRAEPDAGAEIRGALPHDATGVEVLGFDPSGRWARVSMPESTGWVSGRFLVLDRATWAQGELPETLHCVGTEPFWSLSRTDGGLELSRPDTVTRSMDLRVVLDRGIDGDAMRSLIAGDDSGRVTAVIQPQACSDGMSDREFGLSATVIMDGQGQGSQMLTGCCSVAAR